MDGVAYQTLIDRLVRGQPLGISFPVLASTTTLTSKDAREGLAYPLGRKHPLVVGRSPAVSDVVVPLDDVSRRHCSVGFRSPWTRTIRVTDLGTKNGTRVNGSEVPRGRNMAVADSVVALNVSGRTTLAIMDERSFTDYLGMLSRLGGTPRP